MVAGIPKPRTPVKQQADRTGSLMQSVTNRRQCLALLLSLPTQPLVTDSLTALNHEIKGDNGKTQHLGLSGGFNRPICSPVHARHRCSQHHNVQEAKRPFCAVGARANTQIGPLTLTWTYVGSRSGYYERLPSASRSPASAKTKFSLQAADQIYPAEAYQQYLERVLTTLQVQTLMQDAAHLGPGYHSNTVYAAPASR